MNETLYRQALEAEGITQNAINSRISRANKGEEILERSFDTVTASDDLMYDSLMILRQYDNPRNAPLQNSLRKYYYFRNGREFPRLQNYKR